MREIYLISVWAIVGMIHSRSARLTPYAAGQTLGQWVSCQSFDLEVEVFEKMKTELDYEISHTQFGAAVGIYLLPFIGTWGS